jgi:HSP20 family protein
VAFARWDPIRDLLALQQHLDRLDPGPGGWSPAMDLYEAEDRYVLTAELPGLQRADVQIQFHDGRLTIEGHRRHSDTPCEQYHRVERPHGRFSRTFQLPQPVDVDAISADLQHGVLTIEVPKARDAGRRIRVS